MANALIEIAHLTKSYTLGGIKNNILKELSLTINNNESVAIIGVSGSGKSTLMNIIGLLDSYDSGQYHFNGADTAKLSSNELAYYRNRHIGFVFQQFNLLSRFSAKQNVALPLIYRNIDSAEINQRVTQALSRVGMHAFAHHKPNELSGGQQQRVAIARALVGEAGMILADEPTGALDSETSKEILKLFLTLNTEGRTIVIITHDKKVASQCSRRIAMVDGQITQENSF